jgi:hypothetical protein
MTRSFPKKKPFRSSSLVIARSIRTANSSGGSDIACAAEIVERSMDATRSAAPAVEETDVPVFDDSGAFVGRGSAGRPDTEPHLR